MGIILAFLRPFLPQMLIALTCVMGLTAAYWKVRHDEKVRIMQQIDKEKSDAIAKAKDAREKFYFLCNSVPSCRVPDEWYRD